VSTRFFSVVIDTRDVRAMGAWWAAALRWSVIHEADDEVVVIPPDAEISEGVPGLVFVPVPEAKTTKNRIHLDLASRSVEHQAELVGELLAAGASRIDIGQDDSVPWVVLADPEGNEFCVLQPRREDRGEGTLDAVVVDAADPEALAAFWIEASGRRLGYQDEQIVVLQHPDGILPDLEFLRSSDGRRVKNRLHLDVAPWPDGDQTAEVARLVALGATTVDVGQGPDVTWTVLADPEGNEFCVLRPR
jgi:predicted enzyme related to lactoylglutathione lyase